MGDHQILRRRILRSYRAMASRCYDCWHCQQTIDPGEEYEGEIIALRIRYDEHTVRDQISTWRRHGFGCLPPDEPDECRDEHDLDLPLAA